MSPSHTVSQVSNSRFWDISVKASDASERYFNVVKKKTLLSFYDLSPVQFVKAPYEYQFILILLNISSCRSVAG